MRRILYHARATVTNQVYISTEHQPTPPTQTPAMDSTSFSTPTTGPFDPNDELVICDPRLKNLKIVIRPVSCTEVSDGIRHVHDKGNLWALFRNNGKELMLPFSGCMAFVISVKKIGETTAEAIRMKFKVKNKYGENSKFTIINVDEEYMMNCNAGDDKSEFVAYAPEDIGIEQGSDENLCSFVFGACVMNEPETVYQSKGLTRSGCGTTRGGGGVTRGGGGMAGRNAIVGGGNETKNQFKGVKVYQKFEEMNWKFRIKFQTATSYKRKTIDDDLKFEKDEPINYSIHKNKKMKTGMYVDFKIQVKSSESDHGAETLVPIPEVEDDGKKYIFRLKKDHYKLSFRFKQEQPDTWQKLKCVFVNENNQSDKSDEYDCILDSDAGYWFFPMALYNMKRDSGQGWLLQTKSNETILKMEFICD